MRFQIYGGVVVKLWVFSRVQGNMLLIYLFYELNLNWALYGVQSPTKRSTDFDKINVTFWLLWQISEFFIQNSFNALTYRTTGFLLRFSTANLSWFSVDHQVVVKFSVTNVTVED